MEQQYDPAILQEIISSPNLATLMDAAQLGRIGGDVVDDYKLDKESMADWRERMERGVKLATLVKEDKSYPFPGSANVKYPLITTAALQFNARAYPAIVASEQCVKVRTFGNDPTGQKAARGERIAAHMSWQLTSEIEEWEEETDKLLTILPIVGTVVRKVWYDPVAGRQRCRMIDPGKFIVNDRVKVLADAPRQTEEMSLFPSEIETRIRSGSFRPDTYSEDDSEDSQAPELFIEQHARLDLDEDGYEEPYVITVHERTGKVAKIVADFEAGDVRFGQNGVVSIERGSYFIAYHFLPSMDGGFWGTGLGLLLGDISETINTIINMMMDAGHYASLGGGFLGSDFRMKGGAQRHRPGEWKTTGAKGADIRSSIVPLTFPGPDATLFQLLGLLIDVGKEVASVKDVMTGDTGGKVQTATTTIALIEQGMMVFTAAYKRIFRSLKKEFKIIARNNAKTVQPEVYSAFHDEVDQHGNPIMFDPAQDYATSDMDVEPVADPRTVTKMQQAAKAQFLSELATEGKVNPAAATDRVLEAMDISDREELAVQPDPMQQQMAMMQLQAMQSDLVQKRADIELTVAKVMSERAGIAADAAGAENDEKRLKLDAMIALLEDERGRLDTAIRAGIAGLAASSRDGGNAQGNGPASGRPGGGNAPIILAGQPGFGGGAAGPAPLGGMGGGLL